MRILYFILAIISSTQLIFGQTYQVEINKHRAGSFSSKIELNQDIHTFAALNLQILTLEDTLKFSSRSHYIESDSGFLKSAEYTRIFHDTIIMKQDFKNTVVFGPEKIRKLSLQKLDSAGDLICYPTYSPELGQIVEVKRELIGKVIEKANKLRIVKESIGNTSTLSRYDQDFRLVETSYPSPFGEIRLIQASKVRQPQFFESTHFNPHRLLSNIRFPDPNQVSSIKLRLTGLDSLNGSNLTYHNQKITTMDSSSLTITITNESESYIRLDSAEFSSPQFFWNHETTTDILESLDLDSLSHYQKIEQLKVHALKQSHPNLAFYQMVLELQIPARLVYGYRYSQWFWTDSYWIEIADQGNWETQDLFETNISGALKLSLRKGGIAENPTSSYLYNTPKIKDIQVQSFTLRGKKNAVSSQAFPYYFESPIYENEGLGIRFQIPDGFYITNDGTKAPSTIFLILESDNNESISFSQIVSTKRKRTSEQAKNKILDYLQSNNQELKKDKKLNLWYAHHGEKGAIAILQGKSFIFITLEHHDPEFTILELIRKSLHLQY